MTNLETLIASLPSQNTNVSTALERIKGLRDLLSEHGRELDLGTPINSTLETVVREYNKIVLQTTPSVVNKTVSGAISVDNESVVEVPAGYYKTGFAITGSVSSAVATELAALKERIKVVVTLQEDVLAGAKVMGVVTNSDGTLTITQEDGTAGATTKPFTASGSSTGLTPTLIVKGNNRNLSTDIPYHNITSKEVKVVVSETANDETIAETDSLDAGYYPNSVSLIPVLEKNSTNKVVNVEANKQVIISLSPLDITPSKGFDYIKKATVNISSGSSKVTAAVSGNSVIITPATTAGWVSTTAVEGASGTIVTANANGSYTVTLPTSSDKSEITVGTTEVSGATELQIASPIIYVSSNKGYTEGEAKKLTVKPADNITITSTKAEDKVHDKVIVSVGTAGWASGTVDVTDSFKTLADMYADGLVDTTKGSTGVTTGEVLFTYADSLDKASGGILEKIPGTDYKYFTSAKVDLSALITEIDNI